MPQKPRADGARAPDVHGSERAEPSTIASGTHLDAVSLFAPWCGPEEAALRQRIHRAWCNAVTAATRSQHANDRIAFWLAADLAEARVFARLPGDELSELKTTLNHLAGLFKTARWVERTEAPDAE